MSLSDVSGSNQHFAERLDFEEAAVFKETGRMKMYLNLSLRNGMLMTYGCSDCPHSVVLYKIIQDEL